MAVLIWALEDAALVPRSQFNIRNKDVGLGPGDALADHPWPAYIPAAMV